MDLFIGVDNVLELDAIVGCQGPPSRRAQHLDIPIALVDLAYSVDSAHDKLVQMAPKQQVRLESKRHQQDVPDQLSALFTDFEVFAHLLDSLR